MMGGLQLGGGGLQTRPSRCVFSILLSCPFWDFPPPLVLFRDVPGFVREFPDLFLSSLDLDGSARNKSERVRNMHNQDLSRNIGVPPVWESPRFTFSQEKNFPNLLLLAEVPCDSLHKRIIAIAVAMQGCTQLQPCGLLHSSSRLM